MAEVLVPPQMLITPPQDALGFSSTVTTTAGKPSSTDYDCFGMLVQSSALDDSNAAVSAKVYISLSGVLAYELVQGESVFVPCANTSQVKVKTQSGTGWVRGFIYRALKQ